MHRAISYLFPPLSNALLLLWPSRQQGKGVKMACWQSYMDNLMSNCYCHCDTKYFWATMAGGVWQSITLLEIDTIIGKDWERFFFDFLAKCSLIRNSL
jgi:hypothetical protein